MAAASAAAAADFLQLGGCRKKSWTFDDLNRFGLSSDVLISETAKSLDITIIKTHDYELSGG